MMHKAIALAVTSEHGLNDATALKRSLHLPIVEIDSTDYPALLVVADDHLELRSTRKNAPGPIYVDFLKGKYAHRRRFGGGRGQMIARAVGCQPKKQPVVLDITAGLGQDAFILATLGCDVTMLERSPIIAALLTDGLKRAQQEAWFQSLSLRLLETDAKKHLQTLIGYPDVIYCDPMYPHSKKTALVKKEMRGLRDVVGDDEDAPELLALALKKTRRRVVVKRPRLAPPLEGPKPDLIFKGKRCRYDVYLIN